MLKRPLMIFALAAALLPSFEAVPAAGQAPAPANAQPPKQVYGSQLMTPQERAEHSAKMRSAKTVEEREQIRKEHHERMKARAKEQGLTLPGEPPARGGGMGPGGPQGRPAW